MSDISLGLGSWVNIRHCLFYNDVPQICIRLINLKAAGSGCFMVKANISCAICDTMAFLDMHI